jgi:signal transduction histidine kinase/CheY-like chemotaxis protein
MIPFSLILEVLVVLVISAVTVFAWRLSRREGLSQDRGWRAIEIGLLLLLLGAVVDVSDHFPELSRFIILGQTRAQSFIEKVVGFLGGFVLFAIGLWRWVPHLAARRRAEEELRLTHEELEIRVEERTRELSQRTEELQREIQQRKQAQEGLQSAIEVAEEASRVKSQFLANMSHELRSPLNSVIGFANVLMSNREGNLSSPQLRYLSRVKANGEHLLNLINEILDLSKLEVGRMEVHLESVDLRQLVRDTVGQLKGHVADRPVRLTAVLPRKAIPLETDDTKLRQVLINLLSNALKFTEEGQVTVRLRVDPETNEPRSLSVTDSGIGIPEDRLEKIFEAFEQGDAGTAKRFGGTGLGLSISRALCELMGYRLVVESELGVGSTFSVRFTAEDHDWRQTPVDEEQVDSAELEVLRDTRDVESVGPLFEGRIALIIDDDLDSRMLLSSVVTEMGFQSVTAASGDEGLQLAASRPPDIILLDLNMPSMNGWEVLATLKNDPDLDAIPVVVVALEAAQERETLLGAVDVLAKPLTAERLQPVVEKACARPPRLTLVVEDNEDDLQMLGDLLRDLGLRFKVAVNGPEAMALMASQLPDLLLLDLNLPGMDGITLLQTIRSNPRYHGLPVIIVTARDFSGRHSFLAAQGIQALVSKGEELAADLQAAFSGIFAEEPQVP